MLTIRSRRAVGSRSSDRHSRGFKGRFLARGAESWVEFVLSTQIHYGLVPDLLSHPFALRPTHTMYPHNANEKRRSLPLVPSGPSTKHREVWVGQRATLSMYRVALGVLCYVYTPKPGSRELLKTRWVGPSLSMHVLNVRSIESTSSRPSTCVVEHVTPLAFGRIPSMCVAFTTHSPPNSCNRMVKRFNKPPTSHAYQPTFLMLCGMIACAFTCNVEVCGSETREPSRTVPLRPSQSSSLINWRDAVKLI